MILVLNPETRVYYVLPASELSESFNEEQLMEFLQDVLDGKAVVGQVTLFCVWLYFVCMKFCFLE